MSVLDDDLMKWMVKDIEGGNPTRSRQGNYSKKTENLIGELEGSFTSKRSPLRNDL